MIPLHKVFMASHAGDDVSNVLRSGYIGEGEVVKEFERALGRWFFRSPSAMVTVNSATSALTLALRMEVDEDRPEVLTTPLTCLATTAAIVNNGLTPVWVDISTKDWLNFDLDDLERKITSRTGAIMAVHFGGHPIDLDRLYAISESHNIPVIEDCAHAIGSKWGGQYLGTFGHASAFSFQAVKPLTTGDGGLLIGVDSDRARRLRWYGIDRDNRERPVSEVGFKFHMNDLNATIGLANLPYLPGLIRRQQENGLRYDEHFGIVRPTKGESSFYLYPILAERRDEFTRVMRERGVEVAPVHTRNDLAPCFSHLRNETPNLDRFHENIVCLPVGWWVGDEERERVIDAFDQGW